MLTGRTQIGHYKIRSRISKSAMSDVFLAEDKRLDRLVAIKVLPKDAVNDKERIRRFFLEAKAASALSHPNIVTIYEVRSIKNLHFTVSEFIAGKTLREKLDTETLALSEIFAISIQIASALQIAHSAKIIHRDIKPENIIIRDDGLLKVIDFGLAKFKEKKRQSVDSADKTQTFMNTLPGVVMGTVNYMSPEQARGQKVDERTDIWSLGVVIYEMLTGRQPFRGETINHTIVEIIEKEPVSLDKTIPSRLRQIVKKTLQKEADKRYQTAKDLLIDLKEAEFQYKLEKNSSPHKKEAKTQIYEIKAIGHIKSTSKNVFSKVKRRQNFFMIGLLALMAAGAAIGWGYWFSTRQAPSQIDSIAVMPFVNESGDTDTEYLSDGLTESLILRLSELPNLKVIPKSLIYRYKGKESDVIKIGNELTVNKILSGRLSQRGENLNISIQLVDVQNNKILWSEKYERKLSELLATQREITATITQSLQIELSTADRILSRKYTNSNQAYQLYLQGRFNLNKRTDDGNKRAIEYFRQAIENDPNFSLAYVRLADCYILSLDLPQQERFQKARAAIDKALEIEDRIGEAHSDLAFLKAVYEWDWAGAEKEHNRAIELKPNSSTAHHRYGEFLAMQGKFEESFAEYKYALELDPFSYAINSDLGSTYYYAREYDRAIEHLKNLTEQDPNSLRAHIFLTKVFVQKGMFEEAILEYEKINFLQEGNKEKFAKRALLIRESVKKSGAKGYWRQILALTKDTQNENGPVDPVEMATLYSRLNEPDEAFKWLEIAYEERRADLAWLKVEPGWDNIRQDPRFTDLIRRIGLPQ